MAIWYMITEQLYGSRRSVARCGEGEGEHFVCGGVCKKRNIARRRGSTRKGTSQSNIAPYIYGKGKYMTS